MSVFDFLPSDPEERKRVVAAWQPIFDNIWAGQALTLGTIEKGETLTEIRLGERDGMPVLYTTKIAADGATAIGMELASSNHPTNEAV